MANKKLTQAEKYARKVRFSEMIKAYTEKDGIKTFGLQIYFQDGKYKTRIFITGAGGIIQDITLYTARAGELTLSQDGTCILTNEKPDYFLQGLFVGICGAVKVYLIV